MDITTQGLRRDLHRHPGVGFEAEYAAGRIAAEWKKLGIPRRTKVGRTGVVGLIKGAKPGPCVALCADMDALNRQEVARKVARRVRDFAPGGGFVFTQVHNT